MLYCIGGPKLSSRCRTNFQFHLEDYTEDDCVRFNQKFADPGTRDYRKVYKWCRTVTMHWMSRQAFDRGDSQRNMLRCGLNYYAYQPNPNCVAPDQVLRGMLVSHFKSKEGDGDKQYTSLYPQ